MINQRGDRALQWMTAMFHLHERGSELREPAANNIGLQFSSTQRAQSPRQHFSVPPLRSQPISSPRRRSACSFVRENKADAVPAKRTGLLPRRRKHGIVAQLTLLSHWDTTGSGVYLLSIDSDIHLWQAMESPEAIQQMRRLINASMTHN